MLLTFLVDIIFVLTKCQQKNEPLKFGNGFYFVFDLVFEFEFAFDRMK